MNNIVGIEPVNIRSGLEKILENGGDELQKWWIDEQLNDKRVVKIEQYVANNIREINVKLDELESMLSQKNSSLDIEITKLYSDLRSQFSDEPDQQKIADLRTNAKLRLEKVTALRENYLETWTGPCS